MKHSFNGFGRLMRRGVKLKHWQIKSLERNAIYYTYQLNIKKISLCVGWRGGGELLFKNRKDYIEIYYFL